MTQLLLFALAIGVLLHDDPELGLTWPNWPWWVVAAIVLGPKLIVGGWYHLRCRRAVRRLGDGRGAAELKKLGRFTSVVSLLAVFMYATELWAGALRGVRHLIGDWVLVDELIVMTPTLGLLAWTWAAYYTVDRRLREASTIRRADQGLPIYPLWTRGQYVLTQARHQLALILVPLLIIMGWVETLYFLAEAGRISGRAALLLQPAGVLVVFLTAPLLIRRLWDTVPLPAGPTRQRMVELCEMHGVRVRELLLWRTFGGVINAAVMGLVWPARFILLTDGLLDQVEADRVEAVMAHELAHVRLKHLFTLLLVAIAAALVMTGGGLMVGGLLPDAWLSLWWVELIMAAAGLAGWIAAFGWASRRIERQADTYAARHMTLRDAATAGSEAPSAFSPSGVQAMIGALQRVAELNHIAPGRPSWRHGSIAWRQAYLRSLIGTPLQRASVDRTMRRIVLGSLLVVASAIALGLWLHDGSHAIGF